MITAKFLFVLHNGKFHRKGNTLFAKKLVNKENFSDGLRKNLRCYYINANRFRYFICRSQNKYLFLQLN